MELRHLRYFVAVAQDLSFTKAARRLGMAQPPLSEQIQKLEAELSCPLFERAGRGILLTRAGEDLLPEALRILDSARRFAERAAMHTHGERGELKLALVTSFATPRFAAALRTFQKKNPGVRVSLSDHPSAWQIAALGRGEIDVGFLRPSEKASPNITTVVLRRGQMRLAVPVTHPLARREMVRWKELAGEIFILVSSEVAAPDYYAGFLERCRGAGFEPVVEQYTQNVASQIWLVSAGLGVAPMPTPMDLDRHAGVKLVDLEDAPIGEMAMAFRRSDTSPLALSFIRHAQEHLAP
jgi:DNA-binding transcriptional LysR family regulator